MKIVLSIALALFLIGCSDDKATTADESQNAVMEKAVETNAAELSAPVAAEVENVVQDATDTTVETVSETTEAAAEAVTEVVEEATEAVAEVTEEATEAASDVVEGVTKETEN